MKILVVDDDRVLADLVIFTLRRAGFEATMANNAASALRRWEEDQPDLIILDINLPGKPGMQDGFAICQHIRNQSDIPIILLTVRGDEEDIVNGLEIGADDYILKPFSPRQLIARIQAVIRRSGNKGTASSQPAKLVMDGLEFNPKLREVQLDDGRKKNLTPLECSLLEALMLNAGLVLTFDDLISDIWGAGGGSSEMLRQLVRRLRSKIEADPTKPHYIQNLPGLGYSFLPKG
ncbi:MAG: response regulator transcription factor [Anaerolineales bacterium]|nr:response regulator transcription factor [Anaerolineales bacterium]